MVYAKIKLISQSDTFQIVKCESLKPNQHHCAIEEDRTQNQKCSNEKNPRL